MKAPVAVLLGILGLVPDEDRDITDKHVLSAASSVLYGEDLDTIADYIVMLQGAESLGGSMEEWRVRVIRQLEIYI